MADASDAELMRRVKTGDSGAFSELVDRHKRPMVSYLARMTASTERAEELAQETFVRLYVSFPECPENGALGPWLYRTATNLLRSEERRARRWRILAPAIRRNGLGEETASLAQEARLLAEEARAKLGAALANLPLRYRAPLVLHEIEDLSYEDVAHILGCKQGTAKSRISRGRAILKRKLTRYWNGGSRD